MKTRKQFRAPWDFLLITITTLTVGLLIGLNVLFISHSVIPTIVTWGIILGCAAFGVYGYTIKNGALRILRLGWSRDIPLSDIKHVEFKPNAGMGSIRIAGIGGLFGYIGHFRNRILGHYQSYATHRRKTVVILTTRNEQIVVTPDDPELFTHVLREEAKSAHDVTK